VAIRKLHLFMKGFGGFLHKASSVSPTHVDEHTRPALGVLTHDLNRLFDELYFGYLSQCQQAAILGSQRQAFHRGEVSAALLGEPHYNGCAAIAFDESAHFGSGERGFHQPVEVISMDVEFTKSIAVGLNLDHWILADAVILGFASSFERGKHGAHFSAETLKLLVVVSKNFAHEIGACARHDFVEAHLNGLRD